MADDIRAKKMRHLFTDTRNKIKELDDHDGSPAARQSAEDRQFTTIAEALVRGFDILQGTV